MRPSNVSARAVSILRSLCAFARCEFVYARNRIVQFRSATEGYMGVTFGLSILSLLTVTGVAIDYSSLSSMKTRLQAAADVATIGAARGILDYVGQNGSANMSPAYSAATTQVSNLVSANLQTVKYATNVSVAPGTVSYSQGVATVSVTVTAHYVPSVLKMLGISDVPVTVSSTSSSTANQSYVQVVFLVDVSQSMAVGATSTDINKLNWYLGCVFACHQASNDTLSYARNNLGVKFKIDYARSAVSTFMSQLSTLSAQSPGYYKAGIYTFSDHVTTVLAPTSTISSAVSAANNIDVEYFTPSIPAYTSSGHTQIANALTAMKTKLSNAGDGSSSTSPLTYIILVTDGVEDPTANYSSWAGWSDGTWTSPCTTLKKANFQIATIQAYYTPFSDSSYYALVSPITSQVSSAFSSCASSSSMALTATDGPGIVAAANALFQNIGAATLRVVY